MKGLDTNVLVRYLVKDDHKQAGRASAYILNTVTSGENIYINTIVLCELVWVLESAYGYSKQEITDTLRKILATKQFEIESKEAVRIATGEYAEGKADLADYLIGRINKSKSCDTTVTFDLDLKNNPNFTII